MKTKIRYAKACKNKEVTPVLKCFGDWAAYDITEVEQAELLAKIVERIKKNGVSL